MSLRERTRPGLGIIEPCLPSPAKVPPSGPGWLHESSTMVSVSWPGARHGNDFTSRFPLAVEAVTRLPAHSFLLDGEAIVTNDRGLAVFDLIRRHRHGGDAVLIAFDLIELEGADLRRTPIEQRKSKLAKTGARTSPRQNPNAPAVKREAEEDWGSPRWLKNRKR